MMFRLQINKFLCVILYFFDIVIVISRVSNFIGMLQG